MICLEMLCSAVSENKVAGFVICAKECRSSVGLGAESGLLGPGFRVPSALLRTVKAGMTNTKIRWAIRCNKPD